MLYVNLSKILFPLSIHSEIEGSTIFKVVFSPRAGNFQVKIELTGVFRLPKTSWFKPSVANNGRRQSRQAEHLGKVLRLL